ncbi:uncharacterized protein LOC132062010 [Lycium ferocissimum]|uniref:uncharacterized protein LOC132062010 n=1 Tax=Lycium ferocissimum TaxID=112874 RepID=UPI00281681B2|nr:uncharacterized protein LOC132062010 [Lycium ferocissimum]
MFVDTPPATTEASGLGHLPIPRATRRPTRSTESGSRSRLVDIFSAPSAEPRRARSTMVTVPEDCSFLSRLVGVASYLRPLVSESDKEKMDGLSWQCLLNEGMHAGNRVVVLVNEGFLLAQHEIDDLRAQLDPQGRVTEKFKLLLQQKKDELSHTVGPPTLRIELEAAKEENFRLKNELDDSVHKNKVLEKDNKELSPGNSEYATKLSELEATITQLREVLDSIKGEAAKMEEKFRQLKVERATEKETLNVAQEKVEIRAQAFEELKSEIEAAIRDNDGLQAELASSNEVRITLSDMRSELEEKLKKTQADLKEAHEQIEVTEARSTLLVEYVKWKSRRSTLEAAQRGITDIPARIAEAKTIEDKAKKALEDSSEKDPEGSGSDDLGSSLTD